MKTSVRVLLLTFLLVFGGPALGSEQTYTFGVVPQRR